MINDTPDRAHGSWQMIRMPPQGVILLIHELEVFERNETGRGFMTGKGLGSTNSRWNDKDIMMTDNGGRFIGFIPFLFSILFISLQVSCCWTCLAFESRAVSRPTDIRKSSRARDGSEGESGAKHCGGCSGSGRVTVVCVGGKLSW